MEFIIIAAMDMDRGIGKDNALPWRLSGDMKHFARSTKGGTVIMGRKTWESLPDAYRPLKERRNIVLTRQDNYELPEGVFRASNLDEALEQADMQPIFVIGGASIYEQAIQDPRCTLLIMTQVLDSFECDAYFPEIPKRFQVARFSEKHTENGITYQFLDYESK